MKKTLIALAAAMIAAPASADTIKIGLGSHDRRLCALF